MQRDGWTFLTNHGHVLVCLANDPDVLVRDIASSIGITERCVQQIVGDLERAGVVVRRRVGRRNRYIVRRDERFRHPVEEGITVGGFIDLVDGGAASRPQLSVVGALADDPPARSPSSRTGWTAGTRRVALRHPPDR